MNTEPTLISVVGEKPLPKYYVYYDEWSGEIISVSSKYRESKNPYLLTEDNTAAEILASVRRQTQRTIVMISHQLSAAAACDRILVLEQGRLVQQGHHNELITIKGPYRSLWEREQAAERLDAVA